MKNVAGGPLPSSPFFGKRSASHESQFRADWPGFVARRRSSKSGTANWHKSSIKIWMLWSGYNTLLMGKPNETFQCFGRRRTIVLSYNTLLMGKPNETNDLYHRIGEIFGLQYPAHGETK
jgi:hypothetical protein